MTKAATDYFDQNAGDWDALRAQYFGEDVRRAAIAKAYLRPEMAVADVGAGTGFLSAGLAPRVKRVYAVDGSAAMLAVARENLKDFDNIEFHEADALTLPFPDESLDAVFANMVLHHLTDPLAAIHEMTRVLRPGGRLIITDMDAHPYAWLKDEMADVWQGFERRQLRDWFQSAGLVNVIAASTGQSCCAESASVVQDELGRKAKISVFVAAGTRRLSMRESVRENYAALAEAGACTCGSAAGESGCAPAGDSTCCGSAESSAVTFNTGYAADELAGVPQEAAEIALGCGNPLALAALRPGEVVLDIGSGGGLDAFLAAQRVGESGRVIGVDMTPAMLERARVAAERGGYHQVEFRQGYAEDLPLEPNSVDVVISNCVVNLVEDKGRVFAEAFRVLKPGGRLEVSDMVTSGSLPLEFQSDPHGWAECVTGALPESEYLDLVAEAGFTGAVTRRSASMGEVDGVAVYSVIVSARKPASNEVSCACCG